MAAFISKLDSFLWGWPLIILLFGTHIFMTIRTGFIQKDIFKAIKLSVTRDPDAEGDVSQFGALTTALSSTIGTGNIIGVGTAIAMGGPGSVLWMWLTGIFGIATKYAETLIAIKYRVKSENGTMIGGAMYALDRGLKARWAGILFAILAAVCAAPTVLSAAGVLSPNQHATCYPTCQLELDCPWINQPVVEHNGIVTGQAPGSAMLFSLVVLKVLVGEQVARKVARGMVFEF